MPSATETTISRDRAGDRIPIIGTAVFTAIGVALIAYGVSAGWGFLALFWSGVVLVGGAAGLIGRLLGGGAHQAPCPACGAKLTFMHPGLARTIACDGCGAWSTGTRTMRLVEDAHVAREAIFPAPLPGDGVRWLRLADGSLRCPTCDAPAPRMIKITGSDALGATFALVSPVSVRRIHSLTVPACPAHDDGIGLGVSGSDVSLLFRSRAYQLAFVAENPAPPATEPPAGPPATASTSPAA